MTTAYIILCIVGIGGLALAIYCMLVISGELFDEESFWKPLQ